jgi:hypothetical protein
MMMMMMMMPGIQVRAMLVVTRMVRRKELRTRRGWLERTKTREQPEQTHYLAEPQPKG